MVTRKQTLESLIHIAALMLLGIGVLTAYYWFFPLGALLEIVFWVCVLKWE